MNPANTIQITDVGPRDGLQNEAQFVPTATKVELVSRLIHAGLRRIEAASFVSPKWVPQMADSTEVLLAVPRDAGVHYAALTPNMQGFDRAIAAGADSVVIFAAATESFSQKNINCSITESIARFKPVLLAAAERGLSVRAAISCAFGCPYEGAVSPTQVSAVVQGLAELGVGSFAIADTIGTGTPRSVDAVFGEVLRHVDASRLAGHFHDTYGAAVANVAACLPHGITQFETSVAGLGGCPYAKGATGNVATEDVVSLLHAMGYDTGIDLVQLAQTGRWIAQAIGREYSSRAGKAVLAKLGQ